MSEAIKINRDIDALFVIDAQPTFMPNGGLPVAEGDKVVPVIRRLLMLFDRPRRIASKDRHPRGHISLASSFNVFEPMTELTLEAVCKWGYDGGRIAGHAKFSLPDLAGYLAHVGSQMLWPDHAIAGTAEAELHPDLPETEFGYVLVKGTDPACDSYSAFFDNLGRPTELADVLRERGVRRVFLAGLAFDYCVGWSAEGSAACEFETFVLEDATRPVGFPPGNVERVKKSFAKKGIRLATSAALGL